MKYWLTHTFPVVFFLFINVEKKSTEIQEYERIVHAANEHIPLNYLIKAQPKRW